jgi:aldehyde:ferredoxin oxidoreductase
MSEKKEISGYNGKILHIDLSSKKIEIETPNSTFYRTYIGGSLLGTYYVYKETPPKIDALSPENVLVFAPSVITGAAVAGLSRFNVTAKSPLTGAIGDAQCGGGWGPMLKNAGFDAIVIKGKADSPVFIMIEQDKVEIRDANKIWGLETGDAEEILKTDLGKRFEIVQIGPAGEDLVRFACITGGLSHYAGRTGMGAVMGSKNLKAIAVLGKRSYSYADEEAVKNYGKKGLENLKNSQFYQDFQKHGTPLVVEVNNKKGNIVTRNYRSGHFENVENIFSDKYGEKILKKNDTCWACPVRCKRVVEQTEPYQIDSRYGGPEFESIVMLGPNLGIDDISFIGKANEVCNKFGLDTISTGGMISFAMECLETGIISKADLDGIELKFDSTFGVLEMIEKIATRTGVGDLLADGPQIVIEKWGKDSAKYAMHSKNQLFPAHMPRIKKGLGLIYAVNPFGADHMSCEHDWIATEDADVARGLGITEFTGHDDLDIIKVKAMMQSQFYFGLMDTLTVCAFVWGPGCLFEYKDIVDLVNQITGWNTTLYELMKIGERRVNLMKAYNIREGLTREDDKIPARLNEALPEGLGKGKKIDAANFDQAITDYYTLMGWDPSTGEPSEGKLTDIGLGWLIV